MSQSSRLTGDCMVVLLSCVVFMVRLLTFLGVVSTGLLKFSVIVKGGESIGTLPAQPTNDDSPLL